MAFCRAFFIALTLLLSDYKKLISQLESSRYIPRNEREKIVRLLLMASLVSSKKDAAEDTDIKELEAAGLQVKNDDPVLLKVSEKFEETMSDRIARFCTDQAYKVCYDLVAACLNAGFGEPGVGCYADIDEDGSIPENTPADKFVVSVQWTGLVGVSIEPDGCLLIASNTGCHIMTPETQRTAFDQVVAVLQTGTSEKVRVLSLLSPLP
jgi:hypothetical protein